MTIKKPCQKLLANGEVCGKTGKCIHDSTKEVGVKWVGP